MKTTKIYLSVLMFLSALSLVSCTKDKLVGDWEKMVWKADSPVQITNGIYNVSANGATLVFSCSNYSSPWFADAIENGKHINTEFKNFQGENFEATIQGNKLSVTFKANTDTSVRETSISVTAGDIFYTFRFKQFAN